MSIVPNIPVDVMYLIALNLRDARSLSNLLLVDSELREHVEKYENVLNELKKTVCREVTKEARNWTKKRQAILPDGTKHGKSVTYRGIYTVISECNYIDGVKNGKMLIFDDISGDLSKELTFVDGEKEGKCVEYHDYSNVVKAEYYYKNGKIHGTYKEYNRSGDPVIEEEWEDGEPLDW
jgi:antitoxin component YwqK of YwqJK toxin-antitoxin module